MIAWWHRIRGHRQRLVLEGYPLSRYGQLVEGGWVSQRCSCGREWRL